MKQVVVKIIKSLWIFALAFFVARYIYLHHQRIALLVRTIPATRIMAMILLIMLAKLLLVYTMRFSLRLVDRDLGFQSAFRIYNLSQLGKYIPGFVWQYIGKIGYYRKEGIEPVRIKQAMLAEIITDQAGALALGLLIFATPAGSDIIRLVLNDKVYIATIACIFLIVMAISVYKRKEIGDVLSLVGKLRKEILPVVIALTILWSFLGLSLHVIIQPISSIPISLTYTISLYCIAFFLGFIFPFAPAGLGIREAVLALGLSSYLGVDEALVLSGLNRICYIFVEIMMVVIYYCYDRFQHLRVKA